MPYGEKLKTIKKERGLTNVKISEMCNVALSTVTRAFDEKCPGANFETYVAFANGLGFSLDELAGLKPPEKPSEDLSRLLKEKDDKIEQLMLGIKTLHADNNSLREDNKSLRKDNDSLRKVRKRTFIILIFLVAALSSYLIYDLLNGHLGIFRH